MEPFAAFLQVLSDVKDPRRGQGKRYTLPHLLLFTILATLAGADSYRTICIFIEERFNILCEIFKLNWKKAPAHTTIRDILLALDSSDLEAVFRRHAAALDDKAPRKGTRVVAFDGKALRGSFDNFNDRKAVQILSAFATDTSIILGHIEIDEKSNEIPSVQRLLAELGIAGDFVTADAMHCQKKHLTRPMLVSAR
jgi:hypothetical protein